MSFGISNSRRGAGGRNVAFPNPFLPGPRGTRTRIGYIIVGILWLLLANFLLGFTAAEAKLMTASTTGAVVSGVMSGGSYSSRHAAGGSTRPTCTLTVRFTADGRTYETPAATGTSQDCNYDPGQSVTVSYNPQNPSSYMLTSDKGGYGVIRFLLPAIGVVILVLGVLGALLQIAAISAGLAALSNRRSR